MFNFFQKRSNQPQLKRKNARNFAMLYDQFAPSWMGKDYRSFAKEAYMQNVIAHRCIELICQSAAHIPFKVYRRQSNARSAAFTDTHEVVKLLQRPNPMLSGKEFMHMIYAHRLIYGNAYILAVNANNSPKPTELLALRPDRVKIIHRGATTPTAYRYRVKIRHTDYSVNPLNGYSRVLHLKNFHPLSDWYGMSAIEAAAYSIDQHNQAGAWNQAMLQNGARPSGALMVKGVDGRPSMLTKDQFRHLKQQIEESFSGAANAGRPLLLEGGLEWKDMSLSPRDMDFIAAKHSSARDIALAFGVPPQLLGIPGDNTYSNLVEARIAMWEQTILPLTSSTAESLSNWLSQRFCEDLEIKYDLDDVSALSDRREKIWDKVGKSSFMTTNEKRAAIGLPPLAEDANAAFSDSVP
jgi:HK97 family phage portal protein